MMRDQLQACVPKDVFDTCWDSTPPPYEVFLDAATQKISAQLEMPAAELSCEVRPDGNNRIRLDGVIQTPEGRHNLYTELVWLPAKEMFRGKARLRPLAEDEEPLYGRFETDAGSDEEDEELVPVFVPPLVTVLAALEQKNGTPLTESEVLKIRDDAVCIALPPNAAIEMEKERGYTDIDPENCWAEWLEVRGTL